MPRTILCFLKSNKRSIVCVWGILLLAGSFGCVKTPTLPQPTLPNTTPIGLIDLRAVDSIPGLLYQRPPIGFVEGFFQGVQRGAVVGGQVGYKMAKTFVVRTPQFLDKCYEQAKARGGNCTLIAVTFVPILSLMALVATPAIATPTVAIQGGFTAYSQAEVEAWKQVLRDAQDQLQIQNTLREHVGRSIASCCPRHLLASVDMSDVLTSRQGAAILQTEVLQLGLAEASSEIRSESDNNDSSKSPFMALNEIFQQTQSSVYMLVQAKLLRAQDHSLIDKREFGYLSAPRPYGEWSANNASLFRDELATAYQSLGKEISYALVQRAPFPDADKMPQ